AWKVFWSKVDITAGLLATTEASPLADAAPAIERPWALTLFSLSRKAAAWAWLKAMAPAMPSARAVNCTRRGWVCIAGVSLHRQVFGCVVRLGRCPPPWPFLPEAPSRLTTRTHYTV